MNDFRDIYTHTHVFFSFSFFFPFLRISAEHLTVQRGMDEDKQLYSESPLVGLMSGGRGR